MRNCRIFNFLNKFFRQLEKSWALVPNHITNVAYVSNIKIFGSYKLFSIMDGKNSYILAK